MPASARMTAMENELLSLGGIVLALGLLIYLCAVTAFS